jgi:hypothetical protein
MNAKHHASHEPLLASMKVHAGGSLLHLRDRQAINMQDAAGWTVTALAGSVWITQEGDNRDIALNKGESFTVERSGSTLVSPFGDARICVSHKEPRNRDLSGLRIAA